VASNSLLDADRELVETFRGCHAPPQLKGLVMSNSDRLRRAHNSFAK